MYKLIKNKFDLLNVGRRNKKVSNVRNIDGVHESRQQLCHRAGLGPTLKGHVQASSRTSHAQTSSRVCQPRNASGHAVKLRRAEGPKKLRVKINHLIQASQVRN